MGSPLLHWLEGTGGDALSTQKPGVLAHALWERKQHGEGERCAQGHTAGPKIESIGRVSSFWLQSEEDFSS